MNPQEARERAEQAAVDQIEEERVAQEDETFRAEAEKPFFVPSPPMPPWLFADERSQRRTEAMAREEGPWDDYSPWENEQMFR